MLRSDREDLSAQQEALRAARVGLRVALQDLAEAADLASHALGTKRPPPVTDLLVPVHTARTAVERAEQTVTIAETDMAGAAGEDT